MDTHDKEMIIEHIKSVKRWPKKSGKSDYIRLLERGKLTRAEAIRAFAYECVCGDPGKQTDGDPELCKVYTCALRPYCQWVSRTD
jgi:hypothetical protein